MQALVHHWQKCIADGGEYAEKQCFFVAENLLYQSYCALHMCYSFYEKKTRDVTFDATYVYAAQENSSSLIAAQTSQRVGHTLDFY